MKPNRTGAALSLLAAGALLLSACGSDDNTVSGGAGRFVRAAAAGDCGGKKALKSSGSTAQANAMTRFVTAYETACSGQTLNYTSNGSGAGVSEFIGKQTDFGGSDSPLSDDKGESTRRPSAAAAPAWNLPAVFGPIAVTYNLAGCRRPGPGRTRPPPRSSTAPSRLGRPGDQGAQRGATLPAEPINVVFRSDESGTTDNFQKYLDAASDGAWGKGAGQVLQRRCRRGRQGQRRHLGGDQEHRRAPSPTTSGRSPSRRICPSPRSSPRPARSRSRSAPRPAGKTIDGAKIKGEGNDLVLDTVVVLQADRAGLLPDRAGDLRDRLLEVLRCRDRPRRSRRSCSRHYQQTARKAWRTTDTSRSPTPSRLG